MKLQQDNVLRFFLLSATGLLVFTAFLFGIIGLVIIYLLLGLVVWVAGEGGSRIIPTLFLWYPVFLFDKMELIQK